MANERLRKLMYSEGIKHKEVAEVLGVLPTSFSKLMSRELSDRKREKVILAIRKIIEGREERKKQCDYLKAM